MGSQERFRRRRMIAAILAATMPVPLNHVQAWEPVRVDRNFNTAAPTSAAPTSAAPTSAAPTPAFPTPGTSTPGSPAIQVRLPARAPRALHGDVFTAQPGKVKPVRIVDNLASFAESKTLEAATTGSISTVQPEERARPPIHTATKTQKASNAVKIDDPLPSLVESRSAWSQTMFNNAQTLVADSQPIHSAEGMIVHDESGKGRFASPAPAIPQVHVASLPSSASATLAKRGGTPSYAQQPVQPAQPVRIEDHLAAADRLEMLGGHGFSAPLNTSAPLSMAAPLSTPAPLSMAASASAPQPPRPEPATLASSSLIQDNVKKRPAAEAEGEKADAENVAAPTGELVAGAAAPTLKISRIDALELALQRNPNLRVLARTPQIVDTDVTVADAFFDPVFLAGVQGAKQDQQLTDTLQSFGGLFNENQRDLLAPQNGLNNLAIGQQLRGGGNYEIGVGTAYENFDRVGVFRLVNPAWQSALNFRYEQPLFEGRGRDIAESLIEIARINSRQSVEEFRAEVNAILRDAEVAYWNLALLEQQSKAYAAVLEQSRLQVEAENDRLDLGDSILPDVLESKDQYAELQSLVAITETQRRNAAQILANILGYTPEQAAQLTTSDSETPQVYLPNLDEALARLTFRPELQAQRAAIRSSEVEVRRAINTLQPDLRMLVNYSVTGLGENLADSMETVADNDFTFAALGFVLQQPIGRRAEFAQVRRANLTLCQERQRLEALQHQYTHELRGLYAQLQTQAEVVKLARQREEIAQQQYDLRLELRNQGEGDINSVLRTQQRLSLAKVFVNDSLYAYQQLLVRWQFEQGAIGDDRIAIAP